jgi:hypothetical protein
MTGRHHEAAVERPLTVGEDRLHHGLEIVVNHALRHELIAVGTSRGLLSRYAEYQA